MAVLFYIHPQMRGKPENTTTFQRAGCLYSPALEPAAIRSAPAAPALCRLKTAR